ncbi:hypothetical protein SCLCIDRAFT_340569 [Scleroderma citrinum Foug A]|uniref:Secreted protein n=1 Tax=Scleroderma citrinum Foug A TaxID=1036808 RepID=A0A0C2YZ30_9AGAM|nr:hypothetical protein SCLCIDRAFT_340569 [Scleroderma citrinum Foug A]
MIQVRVLNLWCSTALCSCLLRRRSGPMTFYGQFGFICRTLEDSRHISLSVLGSTRIEPQVVLSTARMHRWCLYRSSLIAHRRVNMHSVGVHT